MAFGLKMSFVPAQSRGKALQKPGHCYKQLPRAETKDGSGPKYSPLQPYRALRLQIYTGAQDLAGHLPTAVLHKQWQLNKCTEAISPKGSEMLQATQ